MGNASRKPMNFVGNSGRATFSRVPSISESMKRKPSPPTLALRCALAPLRKHRGQVVLVILDMVMDPGMDGCETYRHMLEVRGAMRAIIVSGYAENERVREAQSLGAGAYVRKPYTLERLAGAVRGEMER